MRINRRLQCSAAIAVVTLAATLASTPVPAQTTEETKAQTEQLKAQAELERARADNARAAAERISALGLPSFEGRTTLNQGAGSMEATMLASYAVDAAALRISGQVERAQSAANPTTNVIVLAGDEALDFGRVGAMDTELNAISDVFAQLGFAAPHVAEAVPLEGSEAGGVAASAVIAAATAAAGLLRSNTEVTALDLQAISNRALATAVAARLDSAILPSAAIGRLADSPASASGWRGMSLFQKYTNLLERRRLINEARGPAPVEPAKPTERYKELTAALARFDAAAARITTPDATTGVVPLAQAMRLEAMSRDNPRVLRVYVDRAGGSLINRTNILTTVGLKDPVRVSGGMLASYTLTDPASGRLLAADIITCRTTSTPLRSVHRGVWGNRVGGRRIQGATCSGRAPEVAGRN